MIDEIRKLVGRKRIWLAKAGIWTTDAIFRETKDKVIKYGSRNILGVDMESTALMTVAQYRKVKLAIALAISDELYGKEWKPGFKTKKLKRTGKKNTDPGRNKHSEKPSQQNLINHQKTNNNKRRGKTAG